MGLASVWRAGINMRRRLIVVLRLEASMVAAGRNRSQASGIVLALGSNYYSPQRVCFVVAIRQSPGAIFRKPVGPPARLPQLSAR